MNSRCSILAQIPVVLWLAQVVLIAGCIPVSKSVLIHNLPPVPMEEVNVFFQEDEVPEHRRVGILSGKRENTYYTTRAQLLDELRTAAGDMGANAIIVGNEELAGIKIMPHNPALTSKILRRAAIAILIEKDYIVRFGSHLSFGEDRACNSSTMLRKQCAPKSCIMKYNTTWNEVRETL